MLNTVGIISDMTAKYPKVGPKIADWIERTGLNQDEVAEALGIKQSMISLLINGHRDPSLKVLIRIHKHTGADLYEMLDLDPPDEKQP